MVKGESECFATPRDGIGAIDGIELGSVPCASPIGNSGKLASVDSHALWIAVVKQSANGSGDDARRDTAFSK